MGIYLLLDGIDGGSTHKNYKKHVQVSSAQFGAHRSGIAHSGSGGSAGVASISEMVFTKGADTTSVELFKRVAGGKSIKEVLVKFTKSSDLGAEVEFFTYKLTDVYVTSWSTSAHGEQGGDSTPMESFSLNFKKVDITYTSQKDDNTKGAEIMGSWSVAEMDGS